MFYFAYGSNMGADTMEEALGHSVSGRPARAPGFRIAFTAFAQEWQGGVADLVRDEASEVEGVVYEVTPADLLRLEFNEGLSEGLYRRRALRVELASGEELDAVASEVAKKRPHVAPSPHYLDAMVSGATEQGLSEAYIGWLLQLYPDEPTPHRSLWDDGE